ncbi:MAG: recombination protein RecR [Bacteroidetes bacterium]|nr:recombination protein RecR [Bacteroidota bacterium]
MNFPSKFIENAVEEFAKLPSVGKKTAMRLVLHLLKEEENKTRALAEALVKMRTKTIYCKTCCNISDTPTCNICTNARRDQTIICVVEDIRDVMAIENTGQYQGLYHVLGGVVSPINGIGPSQLNIDPLIARAADSAVKEVILALSPTMDGDTTAYYITKQLKDSNVKVSTIARGIPIGGELEYADEITLGRSIVARTTDQV